MGIESDFDDEAKSLLNLLLSDFGQSGKDVQIEAIRSELEAAYWRGHSDGACAATVE